MLNEPVLLYVLACIGGFSHADGFFPVRMSGLQRSAPARGKSSHHRACMFSLESPLTQLSPAAYLQEVALTSLGITSTPAICRIEAGCDSTPRAGCIVMGGWRLRWGDTLESPPPHTHAHTQRHTHTYACTCACDGAVGLQPAEGGGRRTADWQHWGVPLAYLGKGPAGTSECGGAQRTAAAAAPPPTTAAAGRTSTEGRGTRGS